MKIDCSSCKKSYFIEEDKSKYDAFKVKCPSCGHFMAVEREIQMDLSEKNKEAAIQKLKKMPVSLLASSELKSEIPIELLDKGYFFSLKETFEHKETDQVSEEQRRWSDWAKEFSQKAALQNGDVSWLVQTKKALPQYLSWFVALGISMVGLGIIIWQRVSYAPTGLPNQSIPLTADTKKLVTLNQLPLKTNVLVVKPAQVATSPVSEVLPPTPTPSASASPKNDSASKGLLNSAPLGKNDASKNGKNGGKDKDNKDSQEPTDRPPEVGQTAEKFTGTGPKKISDDDIDSLISGGKVSTPPAQKLDKPGSDLSDLLEKAAPQKPSKPEVSTSSLPEIRDAGSLKKTLAQLPTLIASNCKNESFQTATVKFSFTVQASGDVQYVTATPRVPSCVVLAAQTLHFDSVQAVSQQINWPYQLTLRKIEATSPGAGNSEDDP